MGCILNFKYPNFRCPNFCCPNFFFVADTRLSSGHLASGVRGHSGPVSMYSMNWVTYSFMWARHVSMQGTL